MYYNGLEYIWQEMLIHLNWLKHCTFEIKAKELQLYLSTESQTTIRYSLLGCDFFLQLRSQTRVVIVCENILLIYPSVLFNGTYANYSPA